MTEPASAVPADLLAWPKALAGQPATLNRTANQLNAAIVALNEAKKTPGLLGEVPYAGNDLLGYVAKNSAADRWVGQVGQAFLEADSTPLRSHLQPPLGYQADPNELVVASNAVIASHVDGDPAALEQTVASADEAGATLNEALSTHDQRAIDQVLAQLAGQEHNATFTAAFFVNLSAPSTLKAVPSVQKAPNGLQTFDTALATATNSPGWSQAFNARLFTSAIQADGQNSPDPASLGLLQYGTYSGGFLTSAADQWVVRLNRNEYSDTIGAAVFGALSRNPAAGASWLTGQTPISGYPNTSRLDMLVNGLPDLPQSILNAGPGTTSAFNHLLAAIGKDHDSAQLSTILHGILPAQGPRPETIAGLGPGVASIISENVGLFFPSSPVGLQNQVSASWSWKQELFRLAEENASTGKLDEARLHQITNAIATSISQHPVPLYSTAQGSDWEAFEKESGQLWALAMLPARQSAQDQFNHLQSQQALLGSLVSLLPIPVPGIGPVSKSLAGQLLSAAEARAEQEAAQQLNPSAPTSQKRVDVHTATLYYQNLYSLQTAIAFKFIRTNHVRVPSGLTAEQYAVDVALGNIPAGAPPVVREFANQIANTEAGFSESYFIPSGAGS